MTDIRSSHITVFLKEAVDVLSLQPNARVVDATLGAGGHSREIYSRLGKGGVLLSLDADATAITRAGELARTGDKNAPAVYLRARNFKELPAVLEELDISAPNAILADLGWRQEQFGGAPAEGGGKGFSFQKDEPLHMTYGDPEKYLFTAADIVNEWEEDSIIDILRGYGEERYARRIAGAIVAARAAGEIKTTGALVDIIQGAVPGHYRRGRIHPATRTFQALRIAVNDELGVLASFLHDAVEALAPHGRLAVITFHSLEDRIVKRAFREYAQNDIGIVITKRPLSPSDEEVSANPRARSAKLRVFEKG